MSSNTQASAFRPALAVGLLGALASIALVPEGGSRTVGEYLVTIFAAIAGWYAIVGAPKWTVILMVPIIVLWNPIIPVAEMLTVGGALVAIFVAVPIAFLVAGFLIRVPMPNEPQQRNPRR